MKLTDSQHIDPANGVLSFRITGSCNAKCRFCIQRIVGETGKQRELNETTISDDILYNYCRPLYKSAKYIELTGGEVTSCRKGYEFAHFLTEQYPATNITIVTNGLSFSRQWQELAADNLFNIRLSLNASNPTIYSKGVWEGEEGNKAYNIILNNIRSYNEILHNKGLILFAPSFSMVVNQDTASDVESFLITCLELSAKECSFYFDATENNYRSGKFSFPDIMRPALNTLIELDKLTGENFSLSYEGMIPRSELKLLKDQKQIDSTAALQKKYPRVTALIKGRSIKKEFLEREKIREQYQKRSLSLSDELIATSPSVVEIDNKKLCPYVINGISFRNDGKFGYCCFIDDLLDINDFLYNDTINWEAVINSDSYSILRTEMLQGKFHRCISSCPILTQLTPEV